MGIRRDKHLIRLEMKGLLDSRGDYMSEPNTKLRNISLQSKFTFGANECRGSAALS